MLAGYSDSADVARDGCPVGRLPGWSGHASVHHSLADTDHHWLFVGTGGGIITNFMCDAMNCDILHVYFGGFQVDVPKAGVLDEIPRLTPRLLVTAQTLCRHR